MSDLLNKEQIYVVSQVATCNSGYPSSTYDSVICNFCEQQATNWDQIKHTDTCAVPRAVAVMDKHHIARVAADAKT